MLDKKAFATMREQFEQFETLREQLIKQSRDILKNSKAAIYALHRNNTEEADKHLTQAKKDIKHLETLVKKDPHLAQVGAWSEALEEYTEAATYHGFVTKKKLPTPQELGVDSETYLPGICDLVGELVRRALNAALKNDYATTLTIKEFVTELHDELMLFDFRNTPARRKFDAIKYGLEKLEDVALKIKLQGKK